MRTVLSFALDPHIDVRLYGPVMSSGTESRPFPWLALLTLSGAAFLTVTVELLPAGLLLELSAGLGVTEQSAGLLVAGWAVTVAATSVPLVRLTDRTRRATLLPLVLVVSAAATAATALAPSYPWALGARVVAAAAHGLFWSLLVATAAGLVPPARVGRAVSIVLAGPALAGVVGIPLGTAVGAALGWRVSFGVLAALLAATAPAVRALGLPDPAPVPVGAPRARLGADVTTTALAGGLMLTGHFLLYTYVAPLLQQLGGHDARARAVLLLVFGLAGPVGIALSGPLSDRFPRRALTGVGIALAAVTAAQAAVGLGPAVAAVAVGSWGLLIGLLPPVFMTRLLRAAPPGREAAAGAVGVAVLNLGIAAGATAGGVVVDQVAVRALPPTAAGVVALACAVLLVGEVRRGRDRSPARLDPHATSGATLEP
jgi:DHA1 family inner membrane transport protein